MAESKTPNEETRFKEMAIYVAEEVTDLIETAHQLGYGGIPSDRRIPSSLITIATIYIKTMDGGKLLDNFITYSADFWGSIKKRERSFLMKNADSMFRDLPAKNVEDFKLLFSLENKNNNSNKNTPQYLLDDEKLESLWAAFTTKVKISLKYIARLRKTNPQAYSQVDLAKISKEWEVKLV